ncbi:MAG: hypothetical protein ACOYOB_19970 [Myxococcota bacterium]
MTYKITNLSSTRTDPNRRGHKPLLARRPVTVGLRTIKPGESIVVSDQTYEQFGHMIAAYVKHGCVRVKKIGVLDQDAPAVAVAVAVVADLSPDLVPEATGIPDDFTPIAGVADLADEPDPEPVVEPDVETTPEPVEEPIVETPVVPEAPVADEPVKTKRRARSQAL